MNKTIFMPKATWEKWDAALRSGEYKQGYAALRDGNGGYCCLGVLQHCLTGEVETMASGMAEALPTELWLKQHCIEFSSRTQPKGMAINPDLPKLNTNAASANDGEEQYDNESGDTTIIGNFTFVEIADAIKECVQFTDNPDVGIDHDETPANKSVDLVF
jgi:hypothetical protein